MTMPKMKSIQGLQPSNIRARFKKGMANRTKFSEPTARKGISKMAKTMGTKNLFWRP